MTAAGLPGRTSGGAGHIVSIASVGAMAVVPTAAVYCATKFAVRAISDGLRQERPDLRVSCIHPGVVESELAEAVVEGNFGRNIAPGRPQEIAALLDEIAEDSERLAQWGKAGRVYVQQFEKTQVFENFLGELEAVRRR